MAILGFAGFALAYDAGAVEVNVCTDLGAFRIEVLAEDAPLHAANFLTHVENGFYNGTAIHRVLPDTIVQGGGYDRRLQRRPATEPVPNESDNGISNVRGTVAAARTDDPDSATTQFFVNLTDSPRLDSTSRRPGYTVFGRVTSGMDVLDAIGALPTGAAGPLPREVPDPLVVIDSMTVVNPDEPAEAAEAPEGAAEAADAAEPSAASPEDRIEAARADEDWAGVLAAVSSLRGDCRTLSPAELTAEAEAALALGDPMRARFILDDYFAMTAAGDPGLAHAQALYRQIPPDQQSGIRPLIAHCPLPARPEIPDGRTVDLETMVEAQTAVRQYMDESDAYIDCLSMVIDEQDLTDAQEVAAVGEHNETVERMERLAEEFNRQVRAFRARN
jgi:peptidyl-prolyl cis-trans isomerase A (cyclophilin A)